MSELVERHLESMTEEIEEMKRIGLFSADETKVILKKRKQFEYKINGVTKNLEDFKEYIQYEKIVLKDIKIRRNKHRIPDKKSTIEFKIMKRIKYLYEVAVQRFDHDFSLYLAYFKFCKESNFHQAATLIVQNMMKNFSQTVEVWQVAAAWYMKRDINEALNVIHKGLAIHKTSQLLYLEAIQYELQNSSKDNNGDDGKLQSPNHMLICKKIDTYLQTAVIYIKEYQFLLKVLDILEKYPFTKDVQDTIVKRLLENFQDEEVVWHNLAQREYRGHYYEVPIKLDERASNSSKFRLKRCAAQYEKGLEKISKPKASLLWIKYLDWLIEIHQQKVDVINENMLKNMLLETLKKANEACSNLPEKYYVVWSKLMDNEADILDILDKGLTVSPNSLELWKLKLKHAVLKDNVQEFNNIFRKAIANMKEKALPLWIMALRYHSLSSNNRVLESIYRQGATQPKEVSDVLKPEFIQWLALSKGIKEARDEYLKLAMQKPHCKDLHMMMGKIEQMEMDVNLDRLEKVYKLQCDQFGEVDSDVWIKLVEFYFTNHRTLKDTNSNFDLNETILKIYKEAEAKLGTASLLFQEFRDKFERMGHEFGV